MYVCVCIIHRLVHKHSHIRIHVNRHTPTHTHSCGRCPPLHLMCTPAPWHAMRPWMLWGMQSMHVRKYVYVWKDWMAGWPDERVRACAQLPHDFGAQSRPQPQPRTVDRPLQMATFPKRTRAGPPCHSRTGAAFRRSHLAGWRRMHDARSVVLTKVTRARASLDLRLPAWLTRTPSPLLQLDTTCACMSF